MYMYPRKLHTARRRPKGCLTFTGYFLQKTNPRTLQFVALWREMTCNWWHSMGLRHCLMHVPVYVCVNKRILIHIDVYLYVCIYVRMYVFTYVCREMHTYVCTCIMRACQYVCMYVCMHVRHACMSACQHVSMSACQHVSMSARTSIRYDK